MSAPQALMKGEHIDQRGRAELEFLQALRSGLAPLRGRIRQQIDASGALEQPYSGIQELRARVDGALRDSQELAVVRAVLRWARASATPRAVAAFERGKALLQPLASPAGNVLSLVDTVPAYWDYSFHMTEGGWDGHPDMGFIHHELIYYYLLARLYPGDLFEQRAQVARACPSDSYRHIIDLGSGTGQYSLKLAQAYPMARLTLVDLSATQLRYALRRAEDHQLEVQAVRAAAEDTRLPAQSADLVTSFIMFHEMPASVIAQVFVESFRLLEPGGHIHFADVAPYSERPAYKAWQDDWDADNANEPWWREAATVDLGAAAALAGFVDIDQRALGADGYPWVITATKPYPQP